MASCNFSIALILLQHLANLVIIQLHLHPALDLRPKALRRQLTRPCPILAEEWQQLVEN
jgi:hypothetical protein